MVKAKKTKNIHLTLVKKKGVQLKKDVIEKIRSNVDKYDSIYLFSFDKSANTVLLQEMREYWKPNGRFTFAKNTVTAIALGKQAKDEYHNNLHLISNDIKGNVCVLYTSSPKQHVIDYVQKTKISGIDLKLISFWDKSGAYFKYKNEIMDED